jgi:hypothetical protein
MIGAAYLKKRKKRRTPGADVAKTGFRSWADTVKFEKYL